MFGWKKKSPKTILEQAKENLRNRPVFVAKRLIDLVDADLLKNTKKGYSYGSVFHQRYDVKVDREVLDIMEEHYLKQGFEVEIGYPSNIGSNSLKSFTVRI